MREIWIILMFLFLVGGCYMEKHQKNPRYTPAVIALFGSVFGEMLFCDLVISDPQLLTFILASIALVPDFAIPYIVYNKINDWRDREGLQIIR